MDLPPLRSVKEFIPVPEIFHSSETEKPFERCLMCGRGLLTRGEKYLIEKAFNKGETLFEYAMCLDCRDDLEESLSHGSRRLIEHYFDEHVDFVHRRGDLLVRHEDLSIEPWLNHCLVKGHAIDPLGEYQIYTICEDTDMLFTYMPYALSGEALEDIVGMLSAETVGVLDAFTGKYLGLPEGGKLPRALLS